MELNNDNIEYYIIEYVEGNLMPEEQSILLQYIAGKSDLQALLAAYKQTILIKEEDVIFEDKERLYQKQNIKVIPFSKYFNGRNIKKIAAIIAICLSSGYLYQSIDNWIAIPNRKLVMAEYAELKEDTVSKDTLLLNINKVASDHEKEQEVEVDLNAQPTTAKPMIAYKSPKMAKPKVEPVLVEKIASNLDAEFSHVAIPTVNPAQYKVPSLPAIVFNEDDNAISRAKNVLNHIEDGIREKESVSIAYENVKSKINNLANTWNNTAIKLQLGDQSIFIKK